VADLGVTKDFGYGALMITLANSDADSMGHRGGACAPYFYKWLGTGGSL